MAKVRVLILRAPGTNCDVETGFAFELAGAEVASAHVNRLIAREQKLADYQVMAIPGGFSYGDDAGAGKILANELKVKLGDDIKRFIEAGGLIIGICNGFQVMVKAGILPDPTTGEASRLTLTNNDSGKFECRWIHLAANKDSPCVFTRGIERMYLPVAHGEGKLVATPDLFPRLNAALYYVDERGNRQAGYPHNPNGSMGNIAGICDATGRVFALMPHPERHIRSTQRPDWPRLAPDGVGDGLQVFVNAVKWAKGSLA